NDQNSRHLDLPADIGLCQRKSEDAGDDLAARPPGMKHIELVGFLIAVDRGNQRVDDCFDQAVAKADHETREIENDVVGRKNGEQHTGGVEDKSADHEFAHAERVAQRTAQKDRNREAEKREASYQTE